MQARTNQSKSILKLIAGESDIAIGTQLGNIVKSMGTKIQKEIVKSIGVKVEVPVHHVASMKSCLNIPWNLMRDISR